MIVSGCLLSVGAANAGADTDLAPSLLESLKETAVKLQREQDRAQAQPTGDPLAEADQSDAEAKNTAAETFPELFAQRPDSPLGLRRGESVRKWLDAEAALVELGDGKTGIAETMTPAAVKQDGEWKPVDLNLRKVGDDFEAVRPAQPTVVPGQLSDGLKFNHGQTIDIAGVAENTPGQQMGDQVAYPNALTDTDVFVTTVPTGLETVFQLRSADSPRRIRMRIGMPSGSSLEAATKADGVVEGPVHIVRDGQSISTISPPGAVDANGAQVAVTYRLDGDDILVEVPDQGPIAWPLLIDPTAADNQFSGGQTGQDAQMSDALGWYRRNSPPFSFAPNTDNSYAPSNNQCLKSNAPNGVAFAPNSLCVAATYGVN